MKSLLTLQSLLLAMLAIVTNAMAAESRSPDGSLPTPAAVEAFAAEHHAELGTLLQKLKTNPPAYEAAVADLQRQVGKLERFRVRSPERYESLLEDWKLDSRIRLAAARVASHADDERMDAAQRELRRLVARRVERRRMKLDSEIERLRQRLESLEASRDQLAAEELATIDAEMSRLLRSATAARTRAKRASAERRRDDKTQAD